MKKLISILFVVYLISGNGFAEDHCPDQRDPSIDFLIRHVDNNLVRKYFTLDDQLIKDAAFFESEIFWLNSVLSPINSPAISIYARAHCVSFAEGDSFGTVFLGIKFLQKHKSGEFAMGASTAILYHEFWHLVQMRFFGYETFQAYRKKMGEIGLELQADFLSGWSMQRLIKANVADYNIEEVISIYSEIGDINTADKGHHGTYEDRAKAFVRGYQYGEIIQNNYYYSAFDASMKFIDPEYNFADEINVEMFN